MEWIRHIVREVIQEELKLKSPIGQGKDHIVYNYEGDPSKVVKVAWGSKDGNKYSPNAELEQVDLDSSHIDTFISNPDLFAKVHKVTSKYAILDKLETGDIISSEQRELYSLIEPLIDSLEDLDHINENNAINRLYWLMSNIKGFKEELMRELITSGIFFSSPLLQKYIDFLQRIISSPLGKSNKNLDVSDVNIGYDSEGLLKMLDF